MERFRPAVERAIGDVEGATPGAYFVGGSHLYGVAGDGDVDVRGFHVVPARRHVRIERPAEQVRVNQDGTTEGFEDVPDLDLVSYELRKFGRLAYEGNFNVLEAVTAGDVLFSTDAALPELRAAIDDHLPLDVPGSYLGMARGNYRRYLDAGADRGGYRPTAKKFLYVYRALLAALYVRRREAIEPDLLALARTVDEGDPGLAERLVECKRSGGDRVPVELADSAHRALEDLFAVVESEVGDPAGGSGDDTRGAEYREAVDRWMLAVRDRVE